MSEKQLPLSNDLAFKIILEDEKTRKSLLQHFLPLPEGSLVVEAVKEDTEEKPDSITEPVGRTFILDLKVKIRRKERGELLEAETVNVEIQTTKDKYFTDRLVAYASRIYSGQLKRGDDFDKLCPVYSLAFSTVNQGIRKGKSSQYYHTASIRFDDPPHESFNRSTRYILVELEKFSGGIKNLLDSKSAWCYLLKRSHMMEDWEFEIIKNKGEDMRHTVKKLHELSADDLTRAQVEAFEKQRLKHTTERLTAWEEGREEERKEIALKLLERGLDIVAISESTGLTEEQIKALRKQSN